jgi:EAL domain-containing protein (putative c-di-GMP-specific phosphodiesterase class I)
VRVSIDDFGCGHSNLAALSRFPFDVVKIDQQFVFNLRRERHGGAMIEAILALARTMDLDVVAEGVETEEAAEFLRGRGCGYAQGFLYGPALPPAEFLYRLRQPDVALRPSTAA